MKKQKKKLHRKKILVALTPEDIHVLERVVRSGKKNARVITRARVLILSFRGITNRLIMDTLGCSHELIRAVRARARDRNSIGEAIEDLPRSGQPKKITAVHEAFVIATACTEAPEGHNHWTLNALRDKLTATYNDLQSVSHERIRQILLRAALKPWREKNVVRAKSHPALSRTHG